MKKCVIYLRVSTLEQVQKDHDPEGYSIPAQREACQRKAESLDAEVVAEFTDRGESARSADRPQLQAMLAKLKVDKDIDYVLVHKVDRLARNRDDDFTINLAIRASGAVLVSATENIDGTPSGKLLYGVMSTIAEFYSANLATEVIKGMTQKAKSGGTLTLAP
jgi:DNA invertase Pin-like site-specific DNA recombinase